MTQRPCSLALECEPSLHPMKGKAEDEDEDEDENEDDGCRPGT